MAQDADAVIIGANGNLYSAPLGSTEPADINEALSAAWVSLGYISEDGVTFSVGKETEEVRAWQSFYPLRRFVTSASAQLSGALRQFDGASVETALGGSITEDDTGAYRFTPNDPEVIDERMWALEWADGANEFRLIMPRGFVAETVEMTIARSAPLDMPITVAALLSDSGDPFYIQSNAPTWADAVGS